MGDEQIGTSICMNCVGTGHLTGTCTVCGGVGLVDPDEAFTETLRECGVTLCRPDYVTHLLWKAADTIDDLLRWKREATEVIELWEQVWEALDRPGRLGESKAAATLSVVIGGGSATEGGT